MISGDDFVRKILQTGMEIQRSQKANIEVVATVTRARMQRAAVEAAGPDRMFSNLKKAKAVLGASVKVTGDESAATAAVEATGPWGISDSNYPGFVITSKMAAISRKGIKRADYQRLRRQRDLDIAYGARGVFSGLKPMGNQRAGFGPRYKVQHPGGKNRGNWERGRADVFGEVAKELQQRSLRAVREVWSR